MPSYRYDRPTIGVLAGWQVYAGTLDSFLGQVFRGLQAAARDRGCNLLLACGVSLPRERSFSRVAWPILSPEVDFVPVGPWNTDGLVVVSPSTSRAATRYWRDLLASGHPVVFAGSGEPGPAVVVDNEGGVRQVLDHLFEHGHRRIAFISGCEEPAHGDSARRLAAYRSRLQEWGLDVDPDLIACGSHSRQGGRQAMRQILDAGVPFTAVLASNDGSAVGALDALRDAGLEVPRDVAVAGFDDRLEARAQVPPLTTVHHPMFELGYQALTLLLRRIEGLAGAQEMVRVPTRLVVRESCGCMPGAMAGTKVRKGSQPVILGAMAGAAAAGSAPIHGHRREHNQETGLETLRAMSAAVSAGMQRLSLDEVDSLCQRLMEAFQSSLEHGDALVFALAMQQILQPVSSSGDDLHAWQAAISILRDSVPALIEVWPSILTPQQVEEMLDQARVATSEVAREQHARHLLRQAEVAEQVARMTARFLAARDEAEIFEVLAESLPGVGIQHAAVSLYEPEGDDPVAWSVLRWPQGLDPGRQRYRSREFPPRGLYAEDKPYSLVLLPLFVQEDASGFVALDAGNLESCADIVRQLGAALRAAWLYREAVEGRRLAEEASRLKSHFLSMVSHELRTPLNLIAGLSDILLQEGGEANGQGRCQVRREDVERIYVSAQHLDGLIRDVLDLAQSEVGQLKLVCEPLNLAEVLKPVAVIGEQLARDKGLAWRCEIPNHLPQVWGDRTRLRQVALNLVNNAAKFTARGEIALIVTTEVGDLCVSVQDTGLGIPVEEQEVIFDEFRQSERTTARGYGGLGLGLAICKRLVEMHGGEIGVCSSGEEGRGSAFHIVLPTMARQQPLVGGEVSLGQARQVLLLVRDEEGGILLRDHLAERGFEVEVHPVDGTAGWMAWLLAGPPEAVVLDLGLASERGWEILKLLKQNPATRDVPVLFYRLANDRGSGSMLAMDCLTKPVGPAELADALVSQGLLGGDGEQAAEETILIADDEPAALEMYARIVEAQSPHYRVLRARDGREALELIRQEPPDLVLLDLMMPEVDGFGVLEAMQGDEVCRSIPVIVLTGQALTQEDMERLNRGVASVLSKGLFSIDETLRHIEMALTGQRPVGTEGQRAVRRAVAYMHAHYAEPLLRRDVASHVGVSERHLSRCFRQEMGVTLVTYLNRYRVRQAKALLMTGHDSITQVAMQVGFSSGGYFARVFRQEVGVPPTAYLRGARRGQDEV